MQKLIILFMLMALFMSGCTEPTGVDIKLKQVIPITPTTSIEITKDIDFSKIDIGSPKDYVLANSKFRLPIEIKNNDNVDYDNVYIMVEKDSPLINKLLLFSYSGKAFEVPQAGFYKFDNKLISKQTNELVLVGEVGDLPMNLTQGLMDFSIGIYQLNQSQYVPIKSSTQSYKLKICKTSTC